MTKLVNKVLHINNRRTSMRLCLTEWEVLSEICKKENITRNKLIELIENNNHGRLGLTYITRLFVIIYYHDIASLPNNTSGDISVSGTLDYLENRARQAIAS